MKIACVWEHNGGDTLLYARDYPGAFSRGETLQIASAKMAGEIRSYVDWLGQALPEKIETDIIQEVSSQLEIRDADSDALLEGEDKPLSISECIHAKAMYRHGCKVFGDLPNVFRF